MPLINAYTISPDNIQQGNKMLFVVKAIVTQPGTYRIYRCLWEGTEHSIPQGSRISNEEAVCQALFPTLARVADPDPFT